MWEFLTDFTRPWKDRWQEARAKECSGCQRERARRMRVMGCEQYGGLSAAESQRILHSVRFADSVFITEYNKPVCVYSMLRAKSFAEIHGRQLLWIQVEDFPPNEYFAEYSTADLQKLKM